MSLAPPWAWQQQPLFESDPIEQELNEVVEQKPAAVNTWHTAAFNAVELVAQYRQTFTTDSVWAVLARWGIDEPSEERSMGSVMQRAKKAGLCIPTDQTIKSIRPVCHGRRICIWQSSIFSHPATDAVYFKK